MNMHTWREIVSAELQQQYTSSSIWKRSKVTSDWDEAIHDEQAIRCITEQLQAEERLLLLSLLDHPILIPMAQDELISKLKHRLCLSGQQLYCSLLSLAELGLVQLRNDIWRGQLWNMPFPIFYYWRSALRQSSSQWHKHDSMLDYNSSYAEYVQRPLGMQLLQLLHVMHQIDLSYTKKGEWKKSTTAKLLSSCSQLQVALEEHSFVVNDCNKETYAMTLLLELAFSLQLIEKHKNGVEICYIQLEKWLLLHDHQREKLHQQWLCEYLLTEEKAAVSMVDLLIQPSGQWYAQEELEEELMSWLSFFQLCGWISYMKRRNCEGTTVHVYVREFSSLSTYSFDVQRNGEIIVLPECSYRQLWLLKYVAECIQEQEISVYRLTLSQLQHAIQAGYSSNICFAWLRESAESEMSQYVQQLEHSVVAQGTSSHPNSAAIRSNGIAMMLCTAQATLQLRALQSWGKWMKVREGIWDPPLLDQVSRTVIRQSITAYNGTSSWITDYRSYHYSTSKELVQYAINHQLGLNIIYANQELKFNPERLIQRGNEWIVEGVQNAAEANHTMQWQLNDWEGIKLHFST